MLNAGTKPYISVKITSGTTPLDALGEVLNAIQKG
jgi:hypothetical protein